MSTLIQKTSVLLPAEIWVILLLVAAPAAPSYGQSPAEFAIKLPTLESDAGRYQASPGTIITVWCDGDRLDLAVNSGSPAEFMPDAADHFINGQSGMRIHFVRDQLVRRFGSLAAMARASMEDLQCVRGVGRDKAVTLVSECAG